ncbi:MAG: helix-turn-helix transcriptional regulator [Bacteroidales bacterium]|nr:helix-turn-helix transcriptional regulator [Bacteroidales bacterium]
MKRKILDNAKLKKLQTAEDYLSAKYGKRGSDSRKEFNAKAMAWYYAEILKDARKEAGMTQQQLAEKVGKKREYIALLEKRETDMQLSTFLMITQAVGVNVELTY